jgi:hypothetical protein
MMRAIPLSGMPRSLRDTPRNFTGQLALFPPPAGASCPLLQWDEMKRWPSRSRYSRLTGPATSFCRQPQAGHGAGERPLKRLSSRRDNLKRSLANDQKQWRTTVTSRAPNARIHDLSRAGAGHACESTNRMELGSAGLKPVARNRKTGHGKEE